MTIKVSENLQEADRLDAEGRHEEAVKLLAARGRQGDVEARTRLGKRMVIGDRCARQPKEGVGLIIQAAEQGGGEALCLLSVFFALGMYVRQSWRSALNSLRLSAEKGWAPARGQLKTLATDRDLAQKDDPAPEDWLKLASSVDLNHWHGAPAGVTLSESPLIRSFPDLIDEAVCRWLIEKAGGRLTRAQVYDSVAREVGINQGRTNSNAIFNLISTDLVMLLLQMRMAACTGISHRQFEAMTVLHYAPGEQITGHYDFVDPNSPDYEQQLAEQGQRIITFLVYLNEEYEGGETEFKRLDILHEGRRGEGLFFVNALADGSPDLRTLHAGRPPEVEEKWIVSQFVRDRHTF